MSKGKNKKENITRSEKLSKLSYLFKVHGILLTTVAALDIGLYLAFLTEVVVASNSGEFVGEGGWGLLFAWLLLFMSLPFALVAVYYLVRGIRFLVTIYKSKGKRKRTPLSTIPVGKTRNSFILQMVLMGIELAAALSFFFNIMQVTYNEIPIVPIFLLVHCCLLAETVYAFRKLPR